MALTGHFFLDQLFVFDLLASVVGRFMSNELISRIRKMADEVTAREGCTVYDLEFTGGGGRVLRLYIDKMDGQNVSIDDCANVSRGLNLLLDVEDVIPGGRYDLEVSSPGVERVLRERWHYERAVGQKINLKSFAPLIDFNPDRAELAKARTLTGALRVVEERGIRVAPGDASPASLDRASGTQEAAQEAVESAGDVYIPFEAITRAHTVFDFGSPPGGKGSSGKKPGGKKGSARK